MGRPAGSTPAARRQPPLRPLLAVVLLALACVCEARNEKSATASSSDCPLRVKVKTPPSWPQEIASRCYRKSKLPQPFKQLEAISVTTAAHDDADEAAAGGMASFAAMGLGPGAAELRFDNTEGEPRELREVTGTAADPSIYNTLVASTQIGGRETYKFTSDPGSLEGAKRMLEAGAHVHKFRLQVYKDNGVRVANSLVEAATSPELGFRDLFDLPLSRFVFWAFPADPSNTYQEFYDLATHLITKYSGSGKAFYIGHWEGDWCIRKDYKDPVIHDSVLTWRKTLSDMQRAIDDAKAAHPDLVGAPPGVRIWGYAEVNRVLKSMANSSYPSFVNQVVPYIDPPIDFVSYSNWEIEEAKERSADEIGPALHAALDFIACHVPAKPCVPEPRVFVGEFGYFLRNRNCSSLMAPPLLATGGASAASWQPSTPDIVKSRTMWHAANSVAWGAPFTLFWQLYSNEPGVDPETNATCDRAFWLVDRTNAPVPAFLALQEYYRDASALLDAAGRAGPGGRLPNLNTFRRWAVGKLASLAGYEGIDPPAVRELDLEAAAVGGGH